MQLVRAMLNGVLPETGLLAVNDPTDTGGSCTVNDGPPPLPLIVQVLGVMLPVNVIVPSDANEAVGSAAPAAIAVAISSPDFLTFISFSHK
ncbi:hypothetical protein BN2476_850010 [Paraburkholderia piptadeniae]|uniref:Uncharacterized protein n=1 Tax=Paraburkholderia piptadeniae TaxID=1701573 RepID=A0A1N7SUI0_9BURK|nr:hypothetical protein BN2476_850010 [Paraburkholderia piptadeniae]